MLVPFQTRLEENSILQIFSARVRLHDVNLKAAHTLILPSLCNDTFSYHERAFFKKNSKFQKFQAEIVMPL